MAKKKAAKSEKVKIRKAKGENSENPKPAP